MKIKKKPFINREEGFLIQVLFLIFYFAERISIFYWLRIIMNNIWIRRHKEEILNDKNGDVCKKLKMPMGRSYIFPEIWAIGNVLWAVLWVNLIGKGIVQTNWIIWTVLILSFLRVWEMFIYQMNVLFFHRLNSTYIFTAEKENDITKAWKKYNELHCPNKPNEYAIKSATRTVILLIINMVEYVFQFSVMYSAITFISGGIPETIGILTSFEIFMNLTNVEDVMQGVNMHLVRIAEIETILGIFMNIVCLARFIGMLPEVTQIDNQKK